MEATWRGLRSLLVVVAVAGAAAVAARTIAAQTPPTGPVAEQLGVRVARLMETDFRDQITSRPGRLVCAARPFGTYPERPTDAAQVATVYAWVSCRESRPGAPPALLSVAVSLDDPPSVRVPSRGQDRERSIRRIFPADVRDAMRAVDTSDLAAQVRPGS